MRSYADAVRCLKRLSVPAVAALALMGATRTWAGLQEEIDEFLRQEDHFGKSSEQAPAAKVVEAPAEAVAEPSAAVVEKTPEPAPVLAEEKTVESLPVKEEVRPPEIVPPPALETAAPAAPAAPPASVDELEKTLTTRTRELESAQQEVARLKEVIRRIWDASKQDRLNSHYNMGCVYRAYRQYKMAESEFLKALELNPNDAGVNYNLAILYDDDLKDKAKARKHYQRFLELAPDDKDAARVREWMVTLQ